MRGAEGYVSTAGDCDDADATVYPDAEEICDDLDNNCNGLIDDEDPLVNGPNITIWILTETALGMLNSWGIFVGSQNSTLITIRIVMTQYRNQSCSRRSV